MPASTAAFFDLDRTVLAGASGPVLTNALVEAGVLPRRGRLPGERAFYGAYNLVGETLPFIAMVRAAALFTRGWPLAGVQQAARSAAGALADQVRPYARAAIEEHRESGHLNVLATTTPVELVRPFAELLGFDDVVATRYALSDGRLTGGIDGPFVWGAGKKRAVQRWAESHHVDLATSFAYSDSVFDLPLLRAVGHPHAVKPDARLRAVASALGWPVESWERPYGVAGLGGFELYDVLRPFVRPEMMPLARITVEGAGKIPRRGGAVIAANHRSYFDVVALAMLARQIGRPVRFLAKRELFDVPVAGVLARSLGGIPVDRGTGSDEPLRQAKRALTAGELVLILPQGTIPRGEAFFDPVLRGKTGVWRLAESTGAPVFPVGLSGTEVVWPRSSKLPKVPVGAARPDVRVRVGDPLALTGTDARAGVDAVMAAIVALLPEELRNPVPYTEEDLARTLPSTRVRTRSPSRK